jgi:hypothetical protein
MEKPLSSTSEPPLKTSDLSENDWQLERQAVRKFDYTVLPIITFFYLVSFLVRFFPYLKMNAPSVSNYFLGSIQYW